MFWRVVRMTTLGRSADEVAVDFSGGYPHPHQQVRHRRLRRFERGAYVAVVRLRVLRPVVKQAIRHWRR